ncbi:MAG: hypothetical protein AB7S72_11420 [Draconibacterium sp.]
MNIRIEAVLLIAIIGIPGWASAQRDTTLNREVEVVKSFTPTLLDVHKINDLPKIKDTEPKKPVFDYNISSQPVVNSFAVNPLKAATIESNPPEQKGYGLIKAGVGNYYKPYGEFFFNHLASKKSIFGIHAMHLSSHGKLKLEGGDKVEAPFSKNEAEVYWTQSFSQKILSTSVSFNHDGFNYYGYPKDAVPAPLLEENQNINYFGTKQTFSKGGLSVKLNNPSLEMNDPNFGFDFVYNYFQTKTGQNEHFGNFTAHLQQPFNFGTGLLDAGVSYVQDNHIIRFTGIGDTRQQSWFFANPAVYLGKNTLNLRGGFKVWYISDQELKAQVRIAPDLRVNYTPVKDVIKIYAGIDGNHISNHYSKIAYENPFVDPEHDVKNGFEKIRFYGGFDGKFGKKTNFKIGFDYAITDDQPFYYLHEYTYPDPQINPNPQVIDNDFKILYDDFNRFKINAEVFHTSAGKFELLANANYYVYKVKNGIEAWNMPDWDATFTIGFNITERLNVAADIFLIGTRKALVVETLFADDEINTGDSYMFKSFNLDAAFDLNVRGNYKITEKFSAFASLNNFGFQKYERWFGYPVQSFNFLAGVSYAF